MANKHAPSRLGTQRADHEITDQRREQDAPLVQGLIHQEISPARPPLQQLDDHRAGDRRLSAQADAEQRPRQRKALEIPRQRGGDRKQPHDR